jgi:hypothetical protein
MDDLERRVEKRRQLLWHMDHYFRPPAYFYDQLDRAIELAAAGETNSLTELDRERVPVAEVIETYDLDEFVERERSGGPAGPPDSDASIMHHDAADHCEG